MAKEKVKLKANHHLWNNNGTWWLCWYPPHPTESFQIRRSLKTRNLKVARQRRNEFMDNWLKAWK